MTARRCVGSGLSHPGPGSYRTICRACGNNVAIVEGTVDVAAPHHPGHAPSTPSAAVAKRARRRPWRDRVDELGRLLEAVDGEDPSA